MSDRDIDCWGAVHSPCAIATSRNCSSQYCRTCPEQSAAIHNKKIDSQQHIESAGGTVRCRDALHHTVQQSYAHALTLVVREIVACGMCVSDKIVHTCMSI